MPFKVQTSWHVITGASCSGKTTLINQLAEEGFTISSEAGREFIEEELAKGLDIEEVRQDQVELTRQIYDRMVKRESELRPDEVVFLDRGLPDAFVFFRYAGMDPNDAVVDCLQNRYATVFMLDRLLYERDGVRVADDETAAYFDSWQSRDYAFLEYEVVNVPVLRSEERLAYVLNTLSGQGLIK